MAPRLPQNEATTPASWLNNGGETAWWYCEFTSVRRNFADPGGPASSREACRYWPRVGLAAQSRESMAVYMYRKEDLRDEATVCRTAGEAVRPEARARAFAVSMPSALY